MANTTTFQFTLLNGSDPAGHNTINTLVNSIDSKLTTISSGLAAAGTGTTITTGYVLRWSGTTFAAALVDATSLATAAVTTAKIDNNAVDDTKFRQSAGLSIVGNATNATANVADITAANNYEVFKRGTTTLAFGLLDNNNISASAGIVDTKLATISTAGKVSNSATTATDANTASAIVARDASGNFTAGTITATTLGGAPTIGTANGTYQQTTNTSRAATIQYVNDAAASITAGTSFTVGGDLSGTTGNAQIIADAVGANELQDDASIDANRAVTTNHIRDLAITTGKINTNAVTTAKITDANVTYAKLAADAKTYSVTTSATTGVCFTASGDFTAASLGSASVQQPFVIGNSASAITLSLPTGIGSAGDTITICQYGAGSVTISPKSGAAATINGSTTTTYILGGQYSVVTLVCISANTWIITGDYI